ncbi:hypothetical protein HJFPF1_09168 [Paramyrothecium foliicola]|nr:hypothetical protein HJFPF1_09168 [Paramyrothecium foliicola]
MTTPASKLALLVLGIFFLIAIVAWYLKNRINTFVEALLAYRQKAQVRSQEEATTNSATV